jgi:hypothetical protein
VIPRGARAARAAVLPRRVSSRWTGVPVQLLAWVVVAVVGVRPVATVVVVAVTPRSPASPVSKKMDTIL